MSKYAKIDENNIVENVIICDDSQIGLFSGNYIKITEDTRETGIGHSWNAVKQKFVKHQIYPSWILNEETLEWEPPVPKPSDPEWVGIWSEESLSWIELIPTEE